jgi:hypothetical protein
MIKAVFAFGWFDDFDGSGVLFEFGGDVCIRLPSGAGRPCLLKSVRKVLRVWFAKA